MTWLNEINEEIKKAHLEGFNAGIQEGEEIGKNNATTVYVKRLADKGKKAEEISDTLGIDITEVLEALKHTDKE